MKRADLEGLSLEELYSLAQTKGIREAAGLPREALIERLASDRTRKKKEAPPARAAASPEVKAAATPRRVRTPAPVAEDAAADRSGPRAAAARRHPAAIPSGVAPDRPQGHDTESMARLYLEQGEYARAAGLYRDLLRLRPDDAELRDGLAVAERAESGLRGADAADPGGARAAVPAPPPAPVIETRAGSEPIGMLDLEEPPDNYGIDECELLFKDPHYVFVYWEATERGLQAARRDLGDEAGDARLVVRLFAQHDRGDKGTERESRDHFVDWNYGRRYFPAPRPGARVRAALGLVTPSGLFAPISNSSQVRVPPADPATTLATDWLEVAPARTRGLESEPIHQPLRTAATGERVVPLGTAGGLQGAGPGSAGGSEHYRPPGGSSEPAGSTSGSSPTPPFRSRPGGK